MRESRSKAVATQVYFALRDNAERYHRGELDHEAWHAANLALWARAERGGRVTVRRVDDLLRADWWRTEAKGVA
ncbi:MAG: hypothetical protein A2064_09105 [Spirochaetes bacterium GWB1_66_5]|nr:MAG: hypothetical protein A2064_09105 [Spirochaetes bacterium GWB1_66_5]